jgi:hypothetical protein
VIVGIEPDFFAALVTDISAGVSYTFLALAISVDGVSFHGSRREKICPFKGRFAALYDESKENCANPVTSSALSGETNNGHCTADTNNQHRRYQRP